MSAVTSLDGFRVSDKPAKRAFNSDAEGGDKGGRRSIDFPVKLQRTESFPCKMAMAYHAYNNNNNSSNHHRSFSSHGDDHDRDGDGDGGGPTCTTTTTTRSSASFNSAVPVGGNSGGGAAASNNPPLQPFDISPNKTLAASSHAIFKSPGTFLFHLQVNASSSLKALCDNYGRGTVKLMRFSGCLCRWNRRNHGGSIFGVSFYKCSVERARETSNDL